MFVTTRNLPANGTTTTLPMKYCKKYQSWRPRHSKSIPSLWTKVVLLLTISAFSVLISLSSELSTITLPTPATDLDQATHDGSKQSHVEESRINKAVHERLTLQDLREVAEASQICMYSPSLRTMFQKKKIL